MKKYTNSEIKARLVLMVGAALSLTFLMSVFMILYSLDFCCATARSFTK
jgi:hypothetical protein